MVGVLIKYRLDRGAADKSKHMEPRDIGCVKGDAAEGQG